MSMHIPLQLKILGRDTVEIQIYNHLIQPYYHVNKIKKMMTDISITPNIMSWSGIFFLINIYFSINIYYSTSFKKL